MPIARFTTTGLREVQEHFSDKRVDKNIAKGIGVFSNKLHSVLSTSVYTRYTANNDLHKSLLKRTSIVNRGKGVLEQGLVYRIRYNDLSKFPYTAHYGKLNKGMGWVHTVHVIRGRRKVLKGKSGRGGFTPRIGSSKNSHGRAKLFKHGAQMLERITNEALPLRTLYGPSTFNMINWALRKDPKVIAMVNSFDVSIGQFVE